MQRIQVFQIPNQHFNKLSATKSYEYIPDDDELSDSATIYDSDGKKVLQESTDLTLRATVLPSMTLMGRSWGRIHQLWLWLWKWGCCLGWGIWAPWWELWSRIRFWVWWLLLGWLVYSGWWRWAKIWERSMCSPKAWSWPAPKRTKENSILSIEDYGAVCDQA